MMVVIRKNGKMVVYFNQRKSTANEKELPPHKDIFSNAKLTDISFREWQKNFSQILPERVNRISQSILEVNFQKSTRQKINSDQENLKKRI